ncbi:OLC1v1033235C1 [Oldenlandia corymbosa var. corymbosa]|uniref:OLC1v1033235C1 n=1 Tax=Oldenlandia corymbosa var. corymbosa TaxID=529605 RepID=A0AAV1CNJ1_OLDCO|nr:OLC1v1033235C1 [Oldenlandia corymbosa var. corymbosa]
MASLINPYGKVAEVGNAIDHEKVMARRKTRRRITIIAVSSIVLVGVIVGAVVGVTQNNKDDNKSGGNDRSISSAVKAVCDVTLYPDSCFSSLSPLANSNNLKPQDLFKLSIQVALNELSKVSGSFSKNGDLRQKLNVSDPGLTAALDSCHELLSLALDHLNASLSVQGSTIFQSLEELRTWLSSAGTYQQTCIDGINEMSASSGQIVSTNLENSTEFTSNSLAIVTSIESAAASMGTLGSIGRRRLLDEGAPSWLSSVDRKLLTTANNASQQIKADAVVAKDGLKLNLSAKIIAKFTVKSFINGDKWLPGYGVDFKSTL